LATDEVTVIGDTLATDIQGGVQVGFKTILTLSGMSKAEQLNDYPFKPDMVINSIADLKLPLPWWEEIAL
jgi:NagD protein